MTHDIEVKQLGGKVVEVKEEQRNGVTVGIVEGYIATWDLDRGDFFGQRDQFLKGSFAKSLADLRSRNRPVRLKDHHRRTVGGFPIGTVKEDDTGLFGVGEINLEVQQGKEAYLLAKQGVLSDFSVGFSVDVWEMDEDKDIRTIKEATVWEGSIVDEPMNPFANITAVKSFASVVAKEFGKSEEEVMDIIKKHRNADIRRITQDDLKNMTERQVEDVLRESGIFSNRLAIMIAGKFAAVSREEPNDPDPEGLERQQMDQKCYSESLNILKDITSDLQKDSA